MKAIIKTNSKYKGIRKECEWECERQSNIICYNNITDGKKKTKNETKIK